MRTRTTVLALLVLTILLPLHTPAAAAQEAILLRYHPRERLVIHTSSSTNGEARVALGGLMEMFAALGEGLAEAFGDTSAAAIRDSMKAAMKATGADSVRVQIDMQQYFTEQVLRRSDESATVYRTVDSTTLQTRTQGEGWKVADPAEFPPTSAQATVDGRLRVTDFRLVSAGAKSQELAPVLRSPYGGLVLTLPENAVAPGDGWWADITFPLSMLNSMEESEGVGREFGANDLVSHARFTLDSLVDRGLDTLAYMRVRGVFEPTEHTADSAGMSGTFTTEGTLAGTLVWSTGWSTFVTGGWRGILTMDATMQMMGAKEPIRIGVRLDLTNRFVVKP